MNILTYLKYDPKSGAKARGFAPRVPSDVEINIILNHALTLEYELLIGNITSDYILVDIVEANKHKGTVQIFMENLTVCSCEQYHKIGVGYCKHIAVLQTICKNPYSIDERLFAQAINRAKIKLNKNKSIKYIVYDSLKGSNIALGSGLVEQKSVSCATNERYLAAQRSGAMSSKVLLSAPYVLKDGVQLYDYQHDILENMLTAKRAVCSMIMGAGKTLTSIAGLKYLGVEKLKVLIVCPKSIVKQWSQEINRILGVEAYQLTSHNVAYFASQQSPSIGITTYQTMTRNIEQLSAKTYDLVIADEIQYIKNEESKTWSALKRIESEYFWGLSGTVIENRLDDLYNIMQIISPGLLGPKWKFDAKFKKLGSVHRRKVLYQNEIQNVPELKLLISNNVFSYNDLKLPQMTHHKHYITMGPDARQTHDIFIEKANTLISKSLNSELSPMEKLLIQSYLLKARQACNGIELIDKIPRSDNEKIKHIIKLIKQICLVDDQKLVVFSEWTEMLGIIQRELQLEIAIDYVKFDGSMSTTARTKAIERFKNDPLCMIFMSSDAGGVGVDGLQLTCHNMLHVELPWNPGKISQRNGRIHRLQQQHDVKIHYIITTDSIEEKMEKLLDSKSKVRTDALF